MKYSKKATIFALLVGALMLVPAALLVPSSASARGGDGGRDTLPICKDGTKDIDVPSGARDFIIRVAEFLGADIVAGRCDEVADVCPCFNEADITALNLLTCKLFTTDSSDTLTGATSNGCVNTYMTVAALSDIGGHCIAVESAFENGECQPPTLLQNSQRNVSPAELTLCASLLICNPAEEEP